MNTLTSKVSDEEIEIAFKDIGCDVDVSGEYGEPERFAVTSDELQSFIDQSSKWLKCGECEKLENSAIFRDVATQSGVPVFDLYVVDFGGIRISCRF